MKRYLRKLLATFLCCILLVIFTPLKSRGEPSILAVGGTIATAGAIKLMLQDLINKVGEEVKGILEQAYGDISTLESSLATDLKELERMTMDDIDRITSERLSDVDNLLQNTIAQLTVAANVLDKNIARQVQDAIQQASALWKTISKDLDQKIIKIERGVAVIVDSAMINIVRIIVLIISLIIVILGLTLLKKNRATSLVLASFGALILIFSLTPLFAKAVSTFGQIADEIPLDANLPPPEFFAIRPGASLEWRQAGNLELLGFNLLSYEGGSRLLWGMQEDNLTPLLSAAIDPLKVTLPMRDISERSGTYFMKIERADGVFSPTLTLYVRKAEEIPVRISFRIWQRGQWQAYMAKTYEIRRTLDEHGWGKTRKCYDSKFSEESWHISQFSKTILRKNNMEDLQENVVNDVLNVHYCLKSGPWWNKWRGWYDADYNVLFQQTSPGKTEEMATIGDVVLYLNEETGNVSARNMSILSNSFLATMHERLLGATFLAKKPLQGFVFPKKAAWDQVRRDEATRPRSVLLSPERFRPVSSTLQTVNLKPGVTLSAREMTRLSGKLRRITQRILLGKAPVVSGFSSDQTYYDALVVSRDISKSELNKTGVTPIYDNSGILVMQFETDAQGQLWVNWLYIPR